MTIFTKEKTLSIHIRLTTGFKSIRWRTCSNRKACLSQNKRWSSCVFKFCQTLCFGTAIDIFYPENANIRSPPLNLCFKEHTALSWFFKSCQILAMRLTLTFAYICVSLSIFFSTCRKGFHVPPTSTSTPSSLGTKVERSPHSSLPFLCLLGTHSFSAHPS